MTPVPLTSSIVVAAVAPPSATPHAAAAAPTPTQPPRAEAQADRRRKKVKQGRNGGDLKIVRHEGKAGNVVGGTGSVRQNRRAPCFLILNIPQYR